MNSHQGLHSLTELELLEIRAEMSMDGHRRLAGVCGVTIAVAPDGQRLFIGSDIPDALVPALGDAADQSRSASSPEVEPSALRTCRAILEPSCAPLSVEAGPSYVIDHDVSVGVRTDIERSDASLSDRLRRLNPGNWGDDEWEDLLDGVLGPWAMAVADEKVISICHTPARMTERAAECGVWTHPDYRGRGYAAAVTATWAKILRPSGRFLFYSTDAENRSSQRVAARLQLRLIGWTWRLMRISRNRGDQRHSLSRRSGPLSS